MQRTLPPPKRSMTGMSAATTSPYLSSARRCAASRLRQAVADSAMTFAPGRRELQQIPRELVHLDARDLDDLAPRRAQPRIDRVAALELGDRGTAYHRELRAQRHHHVGVIHGSARAVERLESHELVVELLGKLPQHVEIGARREARVGDPLHAIEHQAPGALEILCPRPRDGSNPRCATRGRLRHRSPGAPLPRGARRAGWARASDTVPPCRRGESSPNCSERSRRALPAPPCRPPRRRAPPCARAARPAHRTPAAPDPVSAGAASGFSEPHRLGRGRFDPSIPRAERAEKLLLAAVCGLKPKLAGRTMSTAAALWGSLKDTDSMIVNYSRPPA